MTTTQLAVVLIGTLCVLNTVGVVALVRQVGVLHLRIAPVAGMQGAGGPSYGAELELPAPLSELTHKEATRYLVGFVSPSCGICGPLTTAFGQIAKSAAADTAVLLVVDAGERDAEQYLQSKGVSFLPHIANSASFNANVPGAPWAVVTDGLGTVMASGGVNTLDNVEEMLAQAAEAALHPPLLGDQLEHPTVQSMEVREHVL
jgi:hypothetical protein